MMSLRDCYWFVAGAAAAAVVAAIIHFWPQPADLPRAVESRADAADFPVDLLQSPEHVPAAPLEEATRRLAERLDKKGGTPDDWRLLQQSYEYLGRPEDAARAASHLPAAVPSTAKQTAKISGTVELARAIATRALHGATLFIYAKAVNQPGPPVAILKTRADHWPASFVLDDSHAMVQGRNLSSVRTVQLEARISRSGEALRQPGDLLGTLAPFDPRGGGIARIVIDREID